MTALYSSILICLGYSLMLRVFFILVLTFIVCVQARHLYYALDRDSRYVSDSKSLGQITHCKDWCLTMKDTYKGIRFRFNRVILRQPNTDTKYFAGNCQWTGDQKRYFEWSQIPQKDSSWQEYSFVCDSPQLKLSPLLIESLKLTRTHSNFTYYDNGKFENNEPFDDLPALFKRFGELQAQFSKTRK